MLVPIILGILFPVTYIAHIFASKAETVAECSNKEQFSKLQKQFFVVYFLATFSDWLQGPYMYQVYSNYGYTQPQIVLLYVTGFFSSMIFGTWVGILADKFGRKRLCIMYGLLYAISCLTKASPKYFILMIGRVLGGMSTSILFSTFEACNTMVSYTWLLCTSATISVVTSLTTMNLMNSTTESLPDSQTMPTSNSTNSTMYGIRYRNYVEHPDYSSIRFQNDDGSRNTLRESLIEKFIARGVMQFSLQMDFALSTDVYMNKGDKSNIVFSPVSIALAMALVMIGAAGRTYTEIANVLGLSAGVDLVSRGDEMHYHFGEFIKKIEEYADSPIVTMAGGIFVQDGFPIKERFINLSKGTYESEVLNLDFIGHSSEARDIINKWVENRTYGHIPNILDYKPPPSTKVIIASALYFNGAWKHPFLPTTKQRPFYVTGNGDNDSSEVLHVPMMENGADFPYFSDPVLGCQVVGLPYKDNIATMYLVLPNVPGYQALKHLLYRLTVNHLQGLADSTKETTVLIRLPRMKLESTIYLKEALEVLGVHALFDPLQADLSQISDQRNADYFISTDCMGGKNIAQEHSKSSDNITLTTYPCTEYRTLHTNTSTGKMLEQSINQPDSVKKMETSDTELITSEGNSNVSNKGGLYADDVIHKVTIDVTEVGTEAAATSVVTLTRNGSFKLVKFDRPFLFFIRHEATGCILFWGTVVKPTPNYKVPSVK